MAGITLVFAVAAVGVLHTAVPDHWAPIVAVARGGRWSPAKTARAAALAGVGHVTTTLLLGALVWIVGVVAAQRYAHVVTLVSAIALIAFGLWIGYGGWREARQLAEDDGAERPMRNATALMLIVGSSPMIEGIPAFFAASTYGFALIATMAIVFALATIVTYVGLSLAGLHGTQRFGMGTFERYGEMLSGIVVALVGVWQLLAG